MNENTYAIYQLNERRSSRNLVFDTFENVKTVGSHLARDNFNHVYTGALGRNKTSDINTLHWIWDKHDNYCPEDFPGRLSMGDIIVLHENGDSAAYIVANPAYSHIADFLDAPYRYYSTQRPVDIGTYPRNGGEPARIVNFDKREWVENATFKAWGYLAYDVPLNANQISNYELRAASDNPDNVRVSPYQLAAQLEVIGKWEVAKGLSDRARITWYHNDFGTFVKKDWVMNEYVTDRFQGIVEAKARAAEKRAAPKGIAEQLAEAQKQVERGASAPAKKQNKSHEDR
jgi:hypothetical protein